MLTKKTTKRERELKLSRGGVKKNGLVMLSAVIVVVAVLSLVSSCNSQRPVITSLDAEPEWTVPSGSLQVTCNASDPRGDQLSYGWSANGGEINGEGPTAAWTAPDSAGSYDVTVTVTDSRGGQATKKLTITVRAK